MAEQKRPQADREASDAVLKYRNSEQRELLPGPYSAVRALLSTRFDDERIEDPAVAAIARSHAAYDGVPPVKYSAGSPRDPHEGARYPSVFSTSPLFADFDEERAMKAGKQEVARYVAAGIPREALSHSAEYDLGIVQEMLRLERQGKLSPAHQEELKKLIRDGAGQSLSPDLYAKAVKAGLPAYEGRPSQALLRKADEKAGAGGAPTEAARPVHAAARDTAYETQRPVEDARLELDRKKRSGYDMLRGL